MGRASASCQGFLLLIEGRTVPLHRIISPGSFSIEPYLIFYRQIEGGIEIGRFVSGYQDLRALFDEEDA